MFRVLIIGVRLLAALFCIQAENAQILTSRISETRPRHAATSLHCVLLTQTRATSVLLPSQCLNIIFQLPKPICYVVIFVTCQKAHL